MELNKLDKMNGPKGKKKRLGRGIGSGKGGHTVGRGQKGQKSRSGSSIPAGFEGGQVPLYKRLPRMGGFKRAFAAKVIGVPLHRLNVFKDGSEVTPISLIEKGILNNVTKANRIRRVKILGNGELTKKLVLKGFLFTESAKEKLANSGTSILE